MNKKENEFIITQSQLESVWNMISQLELKVSSSTPIVDALRTLSGKPNIKPTKETKAEKEVGVNV